MPLKRTEYPFVSYALRRKNVFCIWKLQLIKCGSLVSVSSLARLGSLICAHITHGVDRCVQCHVCDLSNIKFASDNSSRSRRSTSNKQVIKDDKSLGMH